MNLDFRGSVDADPAAVALDLDDHDGDVGTHEDLLADVPAEDEDGAPPCGLISAGSRRK
jgi:hypothetical protein